MGKDNLQKLKKENDDLKSQMGNLRDERKQLQKKMEAKHENDDLRKSVDVLSEKYDDMKGKKRSADENFKTFERKLKIIRRNVELIESLMTYSYQYNVKVFDVPQANHLETAEETVYICCKLFKEMGANISVQDIDINFA